MDGLCVSYMDISLQEGAENQVRFTSGRTIYVESLTDGRWLGRYWTADGRIEWTYDRWSDDAFLLEIAGDPSEATGTCLSAGWKWGKGFEAAATENGSRHYVVQLVHETVPITVELHTLLDGTPVLTRWLEIVNNGEKSHAITRVSPWSSRLFAHTYYRYFSAPGEQGPFDLGYFTKDEWGLEGWFDWKTLPPGATVVQCDKGQGFNDPFFILRNRAVGEYLIGHLAWSANWKMEFEYERRKDPGIDFVRFQLGPVADNPLRVIRPGETVRTPAVHLGLVAGSLDDTVQAMHSHLRASVLPHREKDLSCLVQYLVPADQGYLKENPAGLCEKTAKENIDLAAAIGAELFTLDAGWWDVPLDWQPSPTRFPNGLEPVIQYVHDKGLLFGLYAEIEGGRGNIADSRVAKEHPDWLGPKNVVNLSIPEAAAWVESELTRLIEQYNLDLIRLDYNPLYTNEGASTLRDGFEENNYWRYYEAFYGMMERVHEKYPHLILQQCAAGGARNDLGTAGRFHESYLTDGLWFPNILKNYCGQTLGLPPEIFVITPGAYGQPTRGRVGNLEANLRTTVALCTPAIFNGMVAPSLADLSPERLDLHRRYIRLYRNFIQPLLPKCRMYHHAPVSSRGGVDSSGWFAVEYADPEGSKAWAFVARIGETDSDTYTLIPRGLKKGKPYHVTLDNSGQTLMLSGWELRQKGISIRLESIASSELILFETR